ncbi:polyprenyl synthetase family protein [Streptomyces sp. DSM 44915]|uniref:Polyprenyl synthetase family protein n=1 Tax=Streptomyces chisholmiae TaxID=3075540 RepID=A0ABU2JS93_9ACTN|nr:polyprenyl synthetase family protein [Streptomyces sp. DSM 44915]MDT0267606.1 polyprenyl synthetase family protein [Streptomyces sp. DSM 44915]
MTVVGPFGVSVRDPALDAEVQAGLSAVEAGLIEATKSDVPLITEAAQHLVRAGGKRFRPLLLLLAARFGDPQAPGVVPAAVVVELTHLATLYHDDIMDEAEVRRGVASVNTRWDNSVAVLTGDFLFSRASSIVAELGNAAVRVQAEAFERLVTGQIQETQGPRPGEDPIAHHLEVVAGKTGSLIAVAGRMGALMAGATAATVEVLARYGELIGVAFQLADDVLDIVGDPAESGKVPGTDLREGVATLPLLRLRELAAGEGAPGDLALLELLSGDLSDEGRLAEALAALRTHRALDLARQDAWSYAERARRVLAPLPDGPAKDALTDLCQSVSDRTR